MSWDRHTADELQAAHHVLTAMADADDFAMTLYEHWWAAARPGGTSRGRWDPPLTRALRAPHTGALSWSPQDHEALPLGGHGAAVIADPSCRTHPRAVGGGGDITVRTGAGLASTFGARLRISRRRDGQDDRGWWRTWGEGWPVGEPRQGLSRIYFAPRRIEVARLVQSITHLVTDITPTWSLTVATEPAALDRADAVVLHLPDECRAAAFAALGPECATRVRNSSPPFTQVLAPGIAWSEEPGDGQSFGELRCRWLGEAYRRAEARCAAFIDVVTEVFGEHGVDESTAHLRGLAVAA